MLNENQVGQILDTQPVDSTEVQILMAPAEVQEPAPSRLDNILTIGMVALLGLSVVIAVICKALSKKKKVAAPVASSVSAQPVQLPTAPGSAGQLKLHDVDPKTAAMIMAIVADKLKKPLNELRFTSIKEVK